MTSCQEMLTLRLTVCFNATLASKLLTSQNVSSNETSVNELAC